MASHHDDDAGSPEMNAAIRAMFSDLASAMTEAKLNLITAGKPGEKALYTDLIDGVRVTRMPEDPLAMRISIGKPHDLDEGTYFVFRGNPSKVISFLNALWMPFERRTWCPNTGGIREPFSDAPRSVGAARRDRLHRSIRLRRPTRRRVRAGA